MENFKRSFKRLFTRLTILALVVACGAFAIAQAQKDQAGEPGAGEPQQSPLVEQQPSDLQEPTSRAVVDSPPPSSEGMTAQQDYNSAEVVNDEFVTPAQATTDVTPFAPAPTDDTGNDAAAGSRFANSLPPDQFTQPPSEFTTPPDQFAAPPQEFSDGTGDRFVSDTASAGAAGAPTNETGGGRFAEENEGGGRFTDTFPAPRQLEATVRGAAAAEGTPPDRFSQGGGDPPNLIDESDIPPLDDVLSAGSDDQEPLDDVLAENLATGGTPPSGRFGTPDVVATDTTPSATEAAPRSNPVRAGTRAAPRDPRPLNTYGGQEFASEPNSNPVIPTNSLTADEALAGDDRFGAMASSSTNSLSIPGAGKPGPVELEGPQTPSLMIRKVPPTNVRVGAPATFEVQVRNVGQVPAERILVRDEVPQGTELVDTQPQAQSSSDGGILWSIGTLRPGEDTTVSMTVKPLQEGPIGSVATVTMQAMASARADAKQPMLKIEHNTKQQVLLGERVDFAIVLENPGSGTAERVVIEEDVPDGLSHPKGPKLEYEIGAIPAGSSRRLELSLEAAKPGVVENVIRARSIGGLVAEHRTTVEVIAPELQVKIKGPTHRYLDRKATFTLALENAGTADARQIQLVATLPRGLQFVSTNNSGRYDQRTNTIRWILDRLPARQFGEVKFTAIPHEIGQLTINAQAAAARGLKNSADHHLEVNGIAALLFEVADQVDPIEVGDATTYRIRVKNQGTKASTNIQFVAMVPPGMKAVSASGPTDYRLEGDRIYFNAIATLPPKGESSYDVRIEGVSEGDKRFRVQMTSDDTTTPVVEEESTKVYAD